MNVRIIFDLYHLGEENVPYKSVFDDIVFLGFDWETDLSDYIYERVKFLKEEYGADKVVVSQELEGLS